MVASEILRRLIENQSSVADDDSAVARVDSTEPEPRAPGLGDVMALLEFAASPELFAREAFAPCSETRVVPARWR